MASGAYGDEPDSHRRQRRRQSVRRPVRPCHYVTVLGAHLQLAERRCRWAVRPMTERLQIRRRLNEVAREIDAIEKEFTVLDRPEIELAGVAEASEILDMKPNTIYTYVKRGKFPQPAFILKCGMIWYRE